MCVSGVIAVIVFWLLLIFGPYLVGMQEHKNTSFHSKFDDWCGGFVIFIAIIIIAICIISAIILISSIIYKGVCSL